jgi:hypothetical protein
VRTSAALASVMLLAAPAPATEPVTGPALPATPAPARPDTDRDEVNFVALSPNLGGELLDTRFTDMDGDGLTELVLAVRARRDGEASRREIHIHHRTADGAFGVDPEQVVPVLDDVIVYACADVRDEPGRELVFFTRTGAFSLSPAIEGYRDNIRRLVTTDMLFQVPDERALPSWSYVLPRAGRDLLLLPGTTSFALWGPGAAGTPGSAGASGTPGSAGDPGVPSGAEASSVPAGDFARRGSWGDVGRAALFSARAPDAVLSTGSARVSIRSSDGRELFLADAPRAFSALLEADVDYRAPALADVNGDGLSDLLLRQDNALRIALGTPDGFAPEWSRSEIFPEWLMKPDTRLELKLADLDADGDTDLLARSSPEQSRIEQAVFTYFVLVNDGERLLPAEAQQVLRLEATGTRAEVTDVDADGRPDLILTKWTLPSVHDLVSGFRLQRGSYVYFAGDRGSGPPFERKPSLRDEQSFTLESLQDAIVVRYLSGDCSGDGVADLVEMDLSGRVAVRRIRHEESFFGGGDWVIEEEAWKRFDMGRSVERLLLQDINDDGIADLVNPGERSLLLMLSHRAGGSR